ncbi:uncharacterized protein METZ01_LOCUS480557, partial [marine metagenome]
PWVNGELYPWLKGWRGWVLIRNVWERRVSERRCPFRNQTARRREAKIDAGSLCFSCRWQGWWRCHS